jgi:hypothetical protein
MIYLSIKELAVSAEDVTVVTSNIMKDMQPNHLAATTTTISPTPQPNAPHLLHYTRKISVRPEKGKASLNKCQMGCQKPIVIFLCDALVPEGSSILAVNIGQSDRKDTGGLLSKSSLFSSSGLSEAVLKGWTKYLMSGRFLYRGVPNRLMTHCI